MDSILKALREHADELPLDDFAAHMKGRETEYEQLLIYFLYRHVPTALDDGDVSSKAAFAVLSVRLLFSLGALHLLLRGEFTVEDQIELCRLYSARSSIPTIIWTRSSTRAITKMPPGSTRGGIFCAFWLILM